MTTLTQVAPNGIVIENRGWYPRLSLATRPSDNAVVARVRDWGGGTGDKPPTGYLRATGALTADVAQAQDLRLVLAQHFITSINSQFTLTSGRLAIAENAINADRLADESVTEGALDNLLRDQLEGSADASTLALSGRRLTLADNNGRETTVTLPATSAVTNFHEFELVRSASELNAVATDGSATVLVSAAFGTYTAGDILTYQSGAWAVAVNLATSLDISDGSITEQKLASALQTKINAALTASGIKAFARTGGPGVQPSMDLADPSGVANQIHTTDYFLIGDMSRQDGQRVVKASVASVRAAVVPDNDEVTNTLDYSTTATYPLTSGHAAGVTHKTGVLIKRGDLTVFVSASGLTGVEPTAVSALLALPSVGGGVNLLATSRTGDVKAFDLQSRQWYIGIDKSVASGDVLGEVIVADGQVAEERVVTLTRYGSRAAPGTDARKTDRIPKNRLPADAVYGAENHLDAATEAEAEAGTETARRSWSPLRVAQGALARIGAAFRVGVLRGATREKVQTVLDSFTGASWSDVSGAITTHPTVSVARFSSQPNAAQLTGATYSLAARSSPRAENVYRGVRVPKDYAKSLGQLRVRVGFGSYDHDESADNAWLPMVSTTVLKITEDSNYIYYAALIPDEPIGSEVNIQEGTPNTVNTALLTLPARELYTSLIDGAAVGITVASGDTDVFQRLQLFSPAFDLDETVNLAGLAMVTADVTLTGASSSTIGFDSNTSSPLREVRLSDFVSAVPLRASADAAANQLNGLRIGTVTVFNGSGEVGDYSLWLAHDADGRLGYYSHFDANTGGSALSFSFTLRLTVAFMRQSVS